MNVLETSNNTEEIIVKPKKKRGRKPKPKDPNAKPRTPKKREENRKKDPNAKPKVLKKGEENRNQKQMKIINRKFIRKGVEKRKRIHIV